MRQGPNFAQEARRLAALLHPHVGDFEAAHRLAKHFLQEAFSIPPSCWIEWAFQPFRPSPILEVWLDDYLNLHKPLSRILQRRHFWKSSFMLNAHTLDPRPETEGLIDRVLTWVQKPVHQILDLGTGSGCLLLSLLQEYPQARGVGVDLSASALDMAQHNAVALGLADRVIWVKSHWFDQVSKQVKGVFDLIVSNPPYIARPTLADLPENVQRWDPVLALDGGPDGLEAYRQFIPHLKSFLNPQNGTVGLEIGHDQGADVAGLLRNFFSEVVVFKDFSRFDRYVMAC
jgi:release factor glutamine methyltransferase